MGEQREQGKASLVFCFHVGAGFSEPETTPKAWGWTPRGHACEVSSTCSAMASSPLSNTQPSTRKLHSCTTPQQRGHLFTLVQRYTFLAQDLSRICLLGRHVICTPEIALSLSFGNLTCIAESAVYASSGRRPTPLALCSESRMKLRFRVHRLTVLLSCV